MQKHLDRCHDLARRRCERRMFPQIPVRRGLVQRPFGIPRQIGPLPGPVQTGPDGLQRVGLRTQTGWLCDQSGLCRIAHQNYRRQPALPPRPGRRDRPADHGYACDRRTAAIGSRYRTKTQRGGRCGQLQRSSDRPGGTAHRLPQQRQRIYHRASGRYLCNHRFGIRAHGQETAQIQRRNHRTCSASRRDGLPAPEGQAQ